MGVPLHILPCRIMGANAHASTAGATSLAITITKAEVAAAGGTNRLWVRAVSGHKNATSPDHVYVTVSQGATTHFKGWQQYEGTSLECNLYFNMDAGDVVIYEQDFAGNSISMCLNVEAYAL